MHVSIGVIVTSVKDVRIDPVAMTFNLSTQKQQDILRYPKIIPCIKFEHSGIIRFWVMLLINWQTDKNLNILPMVTDSDGVRSNNNTHIYIAH